MSFWNGVVLYAILGAIVTGYVISAAEADRVLDEDDHWLGMAAILIVTTICWPYLLGAAIYRKIR